MKKNKKLTREDIEKKYPQSKESSLVKAFDKLKEKMEKAKEKQGQDKK